MRKLNKQEKELSEKNLKRLEEEKLELKKNLEYNKALILKQEFLRKFDDYWRDFLRERKDDEDQKFIKQMEILIKEKQTTIDALQNQINNGVEG